MTDCTTPMKIDGVAVPMLASLPFNQDYEELVGADIRDGWNGAPIVRKRWTRVKTAVDGRGRTPHGLNGLLVGQTYLLACGSYFSLTAPALNVTLPTDSRADVTPFCVAIDADGEVLANADVALVGRAATITAVAGANHYTLNYWPEMTVITERGVRTSKSNTRHEGTWSVDFRQV